MIRPLVLVLLATLAGAAPAAASPTLKLDFDCYRSGQQGSATVTDFDPGSEVDVLLNGSSLGTSQTDDQGAFSVDFRAPTLKAGMRRLAARLTAQDAQGLVAEDLFDVVPLTFGLSPRTAAWNAKATVSLNGFVERGSVYEHITRNGRLVATRLFGTPRAPCGSLTRRVTLLPLRRPKPAKYVLQFDLDAGYSKSAKPALRWTVRVPG